MMIYVHSSHHEYKIVEVINSTSFGNQEALRRWPQGFGSDGFEAGFAVGGAPGFYAVDDALGRVIGIITWIVNEIRS